MRTTTVVFGGMLPTSWVNKLARSCSRCAAVRPSAIASSKRSRARSLRSTSPTISRSPTLKEKPLTAPSSGSGSWYVTRSGSAWGFSNVCSRCTRPRPAHSRPDRRALRSGSVRPSVDTRVPPEEGVESFMGRFWGRWWSAGMMAYLGDVQRHWAKAAANGR